MQPSENPIIPFPKTTEAAASPAPLDSEARTLTQAQAARLLGFCSKTVSRKVAAKEFPEPIRVGGGGRPRWSRAELLAWEAAGFPDRDVWNVMKSRAQRGGRG